MENSDLKVCRICNEVFVSESQLIGPCFKCVEKMRPVTVETEPKTINQNSYERVSDKITALSKYVRILQVELERVKSQIDLLTPLGEPFKNTSFLITPIREPSKNTTTPIDSDDISDCSNSLSDFDNDSDSDDDSNDVCEDNSDNESDNESDEKLCLPKREVITKIYNINLNFN